MAHEQDVHASGHSTGGPVFGATFQAELRTLFAWRRDVRRFRREPVDPDVLMALIETAWLAPSVGLSEPWRFVTVDDPRRRAAIAASFADCNRAALAAQGGERAAEYARLKLAGLDEAPHHLAVFVEPDPAQGGGLGRRTIPATVGYSAAIAIHTLWLAARAAGIGVGWVSILDPEAVTRALDVDPAWAFVAYLCIGHPAAAGLEPALQAAGWERRRGVGERRPLRR